MRRGFEALLGMPSILLLFVKIQLHHHIELPADMIFDGQGLKYPQTLPSSAVGAISAIKAQSRRQSTF